ncbi:MAG: site-specific integrase [Geminicoccaceae bacterium]
MMTTANYLNRSRLFRQLSSGPHGQYVHHFASCLIRDGLCRHSTWRSLNLFRDLMLWAAASKLVAADLNERVVEAFLGFRAERQSIQPGDRAAMVRLLLALREAGLIAPAAISPPTEHEAIFQAFSDYLEKERGLAPTSALRHLPVVRQFLWELCPSGAAALGKLDQEDIIQYIERHASDWSPRTGKVMCWALRAFLRYLYFKGLISLTLADCVPSIRRWKFASLPTYMSVQQVQSVLDSCDRTTATGRRDYAVLMMLAKLGLRAGEVAVLTLDDIDWRTGEMLLYAKGRRRSMMPIPPDVGGAIVAYLRYGRPQSSCRRLFLRMLAPHVGFASGCAITMIAKQALNRASVHGYAHRGAHLFRHSLATELFRSGATLSEIGQLLRHESIDSTRIYAKVDIDALRPLCLPWPGGTQ